MERAFSISFNRLLYNNKYPTSKSPLIMRTFASKFYFTTTLYTIIFSLHYFTTTKFCAASSSQQWGSAMDSQIDNNGGGDREFVSTTNHSQRTRRFFQQPVLRNNIRTPFKLQSSYNISENAAVGDFVATLEFYKEVPGDLYGTNYSFRIDHNSDVYRQFSIDPKIGVIRVAQLLDREQQDIYRLKVEVTNKDGLVAEQTIAVKLKDVNDNAPFLNDSHLIVWEDEPPGFIGVVTAYDPDGPGNGPPFFMNQTRDSPYLDLIYTHFDNKCCTYENGYLNVSSLRTLDREGKQGKILEVPIWTRDSGSPQQQAVRTLRIEIGDKNDNPMRNGFSTIHVYNYKGQMPTTTVGRVYVDDLDDWDVVDKDFKLKTSNRYFTVANDGLITMNKDTPLDTYTLEVSVYDRVRRESAIGTVKIVVDYLDEEAIDNVGSVRIRGISAEDFLRPSIQQQKDQSSPYERFRAQLAAKLSTEESRVKIFSVIPMAGTSMPPYVEVFFAVNRPGPGADSFFQYGSANSLYLTPTLLTGILERYKTAFEESLQTPNSSIVLVNIDPCVNEQCTDGGCTRVITPLTDRPAVIMANKTSLVGVNLNVTSSCQCPRAKISSKCSKDSCFNGGVCHNTPDGFFCECRGQILNGSRCESRTRSFTNNGFAWLKPIGSCDNITISLQFMTKSQDGILFYNGPMRERRNFDNHVPDLLAIQILGGFLVVKVNLGTTSTWFSLNETRVNDGEWHVLDLVASRLRYELTLDHCSSLKIDSPSFQRSPLQTQNGHVINPPDYRRLTSSCKIIATASGSNEQLNVDDPFQLGGVASVDGTPFDAGLTAESFVGCVRNLRINGQLLDLGDQGVVYAENSQVGCSLAPPLCEYVPSSTTNDVQVLAIAPIESSYSTSKSTNQKRVEPYCVRGECIVSMSGAKMCSCEPGWHGARCDQESKWKTFSQSSYVQYALHDPNVLSPFYSDVKILFTPQHTDQGDLIRMRGSTYQQYTRIGLNNKRAEFSFSFGPDETSIYGLASPVRFADSEFSQTPPTSAQQQPWQISNNDPTTPPIITWPVAYWIQAERYGLYSRLTLDGFSTDPYSTYRIGSVDEPFFMSYDKQGLILGSGSVPPTQQNDFQGCIKELYVNDLYLTPGESNENARVLSSNQVSNACSIFPTCLSLALACPPPFVCVDFWKGPFCTCPQTTSPRLSPIDGTLQGCVIMHAEALRVGFTRSALAAILLSFLALLVLIMLLVVYSRRGRKVPVYDDHLIGNVCDYKEEGGGEADQGRYDIVALRKPIFPQLLINNDQLRGGAGSDGRNGSLRKVPLDGNGGIPLAELNNKKSPTVDLDAFLQDRLDKMDDDLLFDGPFYDEIRTYAVETDGISVVSLSSLESSDDSEEEQEENNSKNGDRFSNNVEDRLDDWGPKFKVLADAFRCHNNNNSNKYEKFD